MAVVLNIFVLALTIIGSVIFWHGILNEMEWSHIIIVFACYLFATVSAAMYAEHIKYKYEIPNRKQAIIFNGKKFKKNTFDALNEIPTQGFILALIIAVVAFIPWAIWFFFTEMLPAIIFHGR